MRLPWLQTWSGHSAREFKHLSTSTWDLTSKCCSTFWQSRVGRPSNSHEWQRQAPRSTCRRRILTPKRCGDNSLASQKSWSQSHWAYVGYVRRTSLTTRAHVQTVRDVEAAVYEEWARLPQSQIQRLIKGMRRWLEAAVRVRGGYTKYCQWLCFLTLKTHFKDCNMAFASRTMLNSMYGNS